MTDHVPGFNQGKSLRHDRFEQIFVCHAELARPYLDYDEILKSTRICPAHEVILDRLGVLDRGTALACGESVFVRPRVRWEWDHPDAPGKAQLYRLDRQYRRLMPGTKVTIIGDVQDGVRTREPYWCVP